MYKLIFTLTLFCLLAGSTNAQYCGNSGPGVCTPSTYPHPGLYPTSDSLAPFINGQPASTVIGFENFDTISFAGTTFTIQSLAIDTLSNLPSGICWATNVANNTFGNQQSGCILLSGTTCSPPGQYRLYLIVTVNIGIPVQTNSDVAGIYYYVRVDNAGRPVVPVDTAGQAANTNLFESYNYAENCSAFPPLSASLGSNETVCSGTDVTLETAVTGGQPPYTYSWTATGSALSCNNCQNPTATITQNSVYTVTVTDNNDSVATATITYTVGTSGSTIQIASSGPDTICTGQMVTLSTGQSFNTYSWSTGSTAASIHVSQPETYGLTVTDNNSCSSTGTVTVSVASVNLHITSSGPDTLCPAQSVTLGTSQNFTTYSWSTGSSAASIQVSQPNTYNLTVTNSNSCTASGSVTISPASVDTVQIISGNGTDTLCAGQSLMLGTNQNFASYSWSTGSTAASIYVSLQDVYGVTVTNNYGCSSSSAISLYVAPAPAGQSITGNPSIHPSQPYSYGINPEAGITYSWDVEGGVIESGQGTNAVNIEWGNTGPYEVALIQTNGAGCTDTSFLTVINITGIESVANNNLWQLYPNPAHDYLILANDNVTDFSAYHIKVINTLGQTVFTRDLKLNETKMDVTGWGAGVYFVYIQNSGGSIVAVKKVILE